MMVRLKEHKVPFSVVITGGPCAGKTEVWRYLGKAFPHAVLVPEIATELILSGQTHELLGLEEFQTRIYQRQIAAEEKARDKGDLVICDRGLADGLAYHHLSHTADLSHGEILQRYDLVMQLEVIPDPQVYQRSQNNPARTEDYFEALKIESRICQVYSRHPCCYFLKGTIQEKKGAALRILIESTDP
jgi:predicted ATPase